MAHENNYYNIGQSLETKLIISGKSLNLPDYDSSRVYSFDYLVQFESETSSYHLEQEPIRITIDLYPNNNSDF